MFFWVWSAFYVYAKLKLSHYTPRRRLGERRYSSYSFSTSALDGGEWSASPAAIWPQGKDFRYQFCRRLGGPQSRSGYRGYRKILSPLPGIEPRSPGRPVRIYPTILTEPPGSYVYAILLNYVVLMLYAASHCCDFPQWDTCWPSCKYWCQLRKTSVSRACIIWLFTQREISVKLGRKCVFVSLSLHVSSS
jgi:hypothetical protein